MLIMAHRHKETVDEVSRADVAYDACLTMFGGGGAMNHQYPPHTPAHAPFRRTAPPRSLPVPHRPP